MKIECVLKRAGGTKARIDGVEYHFAPQEDGAHVAEVTDRHHIGRFLSIPEAYQLYGDEAEAPVEVPAEPPQAPAAPTTNDSAPSYPEGLLGSSVHEASYAIGGKTYLLGDVVGIAFTKSGVSVEDWNTMDEGDRHARIDMALDDLAEEAEQAEAAERTALMAQYEQKFGKKAHPNTSTQTLRAKVAG